MSDDPPKVYLLLGAIGSGRREVVADLIDGGLTDGDAPVVITAEAESKAGETSWRWDENGEIQAEWPVTARVGFFIADGRGDPLDQVEAFKGWLSRTGVGLVRVICVVHCRLLSEHAALLHWYDACIHFSDIALLGQRDGVANKWMSEYRARFAKNHIPCLVEMIKKGRVSNPPLVLDEQVRRLSHWFDEDEGQDWKSYVSDPETIMIDEAEGDDPDEDDGEQEEDDYLARHTGGGRKKVIPDIRDYLDAAAS